MQLTKPKNIIPAKYTKEGFRNGIEKVEKALSKSEKSYIGKEKDKINPLEHKFADGIYVRKISCPAGQLLVTEIHKKDNAFFVMTGKLTIMSEEGEATIEAPYYGITKAGTKRIIYIHEHCIFITVHPTKTKNVKDAEEELIAKNYKELEV